jgi:hypothetical protein
VKVEVVVAVAAGDLQPALGHSGCRHDGSWPEPAASHQLDLDRLILDSDAHWCTILWSTFSGRALMHPGCRQVVALLA